MVESRGKFITFEGPEGGGKTTQIKRLLSRMAANGMDYLSLREPGGTQVGERIREILKDPGMKMTPEAELLLFQASRAELVHSVIRPALEAGQCVICDRFFHSTLAYQGYGRGMNIYVVKEAIDIAVGWTRPDSVLLLDVPYDVAMTRIVGRSADRFDGESKAFHKKVRDGFLALAEQESAFKVIDASQSEDEVEEMIWSSVESYYLQP
tara:strand:+ start:127 stop:753 length:627 start_codon:yes stop_codon:yes gene_type:complete